jgi:Peptidase family C25
MSESPSALYTRNILTRSELLSLLRTALSTGSLRFARQASLAWLAHYPGDLPVSRLYAKVLLKAHLYNEARDLLDKACRIDPEDLQVWELLTEAVQLKKEDELHQSASAYQLADCNASIYVLGSQVVSPVLPPAWAQALRQARQDLVDGHLDQAEQQVHQALLVESVPTLVAVTHLQVASRMNLPRRAVHDLADFYHERFPECLLPLLVLAEALMEAGQAERGVAMLHQAASLDVTGQVVQRLWGEQHPYRNLWPDVLEIPWVIPIPAEVAAPLGWNRLSPGSFDAAATQPVQVTRPAAIIGDTLLMGTRRVATSPEHSRSIPIAKAAAATVVAETLITPPPEPEFPITQPVARAATLPEHLRSVQVELERIASSLGRSPLARSDGRFPVYIILATRYGLARQYGDEHMGELDAALKQLCASVTARRDWNAILLYADDPECTAAFELQPAQPADPWSLKLLLADLDTVLAHKGEMIGALLIVGGPEVVPFHKLPNPVDDDDPEVPSDNPYSTRDENYFIPEWPVGRLPAGVSPDPAPLIKMLTQISETHKKIARARPRRISWWTGLRSRLFRRPRPRHSWGYTAAVWRRASLSVYRPIGDPASMLVSPPAQAVGKNGKPPRKKIMPPSRLTYFNLHGLPDASEWYGQRDPSDPAGQADYPVALRPQDVVNGGRAPKIVFSEACYGAHIYSKDLEDALALKFLSSGSQAVIGSTCISYGTINTPLIAGDLLGHAFWKYLREDLPAGEALRRAKIHLAREMHRRQGYLDGEDQKTLISFVLFGDPLAIVPGTNPHSKKILRPLRRPANIQTVCERSLNSTSNEQPVTHTLQQPPPLPPEVLKQVKQAVEQYLPGMLDASLKFTQSKAACDGKGHHCATSTFQAKSRKVTEPNSSVVTLSKQVVAPVGETNKLRIHNHYARLTLDSQGQVIKMVVSR